MWNLTRWYENVSTIGTAVIALFSAKMSHFLSANVRTSWNNYTVYRAVTTVMYLHDLGVKKRESELERSCVKIFKNFSSSFKSASRSEIALP